MRLSFLPLVIFVTTFFSCTAQEIPQKQKQVEGAVLAAPEEKRDAAKVLGYDANGKVVTLREGSNEFICLADDPVQEGFNAACYHKDLDPFMERGRELKQQGKSMKKIREIRGKEVKSGDLEIPDKGTLYVLTGDSFNQESGKVKDSYLRYVVYIPFATSKSTGLPTQPISSGGPWIMDPGTHRAHIMVNPAKGE